MYSIIFMSFNGVLSLSHVTLTVYFLVMFYMIICSVIFVHGTVPFPRLVHLNKYNLVHLNMFINIFAPYYYQIRFYFLQQKQYMLRVLLSRGKLVLQQVK